MSPQRTSYKATAQITLEIEFSDPQAICRAALNEIAGRPPHTGGTLTSTEVEGNLEAALAIVIDPSSSDEGAGLLTITNTHTEISDIGLIATPDEADDHSEDCFPPVFLMDKATTTAPLPGFEHNGDSAVLTLRGLLWQTSRMLTDDIFYDLELFSHADFDLGNTQVISMLPHRFSEFYDVAFTRRFLTAVLDVSRWLISGLVPPSTIAHALALRALFEQATFYAAHNHLQLPAGWRERLESALLDAIPLHRLYSPDTCRDQQLSGPNLDDVTLDFVWWFTPFNNLGPMSPYASD